MNAMPQLKIIDAITICAAIILIPLGAGAVGYYCGLEDGKAKVQAQWDSATELAVQSGKRKTDAFNLKLDEIRKNEEAKTAKAQTAAADATRAADSLRVTTNNLRRSLRKLQPSAHTADAAIAVSELFDACTEKYRELGAIADRHATDAGSCAERVNTLNWAEQLKTKD